MSSEILSVLEYMEKEKGIPRADMIATIGGSCCARPVNICTIRVDRTGRSAAALLAITANTGANGIKDCSTGPSEVAIAISA